MLFLSLNPVFWAVFVVKEHSIKTKVIQLEKSKLDFQMLFFVLVC